MLIGAVCNFACMKGQVYTCLIVFIIGKHELIVIVLAPAICHFSLVVTHEVDHSCLASFAE